MPKREIRRRKRRAASSSVRPWTRSRAFRERRADASRSRLPLLRRATQSRSAVGRRAPYAIAATPPTSTKSTSWRSSVVRRRSTSSAGGSVVIEVDGAAGGAICIHLSQPRQDRLLAVESTPVSGNRHVVRSRRPSRPRSGHEFITGQRKCLAGHASRLPTKPRREAALQASGRQDWTHARDERRGVVAFCCRSHQ